MKKMTTSLLAVSLVAGALYAANDQAMQGMHNMKGMDHSTMSKEHMQKCEAFMSQYTQEKTQSWTPKASPLDNLYPRSDLEG